DTRIFSPLLYQLSYLGIYLQILRNNPVLRYHADNANILPSFCPIVKWIWKKYLLFSPGLFSPGRIEASASAWMGGR
ncbi:MAG: hypothetical protein ACLTXE_14725, partial [Enterocloster aldenensis]